MGVTQRGVAKAQDVPAKRQRWAALGRLSSGFRGQEEEHGIWDLEEVSYETGGRGPEFLRRLLGPGPAEAGPHLLQHLC